MSGTFTTHTSATINSDLQFSFKGGGSMCIIL